jgi:predicted dehydrogenase
LVRLGVIGAGRWGRICLKTLANMAHIQVAAVASGNAETAVLMPEGCRLVSDWREMMGSGDIDGVVIATPPATHAAIATAAMAAGLAVFVEKPLTLSADEARGLRAQAAACGTKVFFTDHIHLFNPAYRRLKQLAHGITAITGLAGNHGPYRDDASVLWDWGPHDVAMILDLMGTAPDKVTATTIERHPVIGGMGEMVRLDFRFGPVIATATFGTLVDKVRRFTVDCAAGRLVYDDLAVNKLTRDGMAVTVEAISPLNVALSDFAAAIRDGGEHLAGLELGVAVVEVLAAL